MRFHFGKAIVFPALLFGCAGLIFSQQPPATRAEKPPAAQKPRSPEEELEQLSHRIAAIYRVMAEISEKDADRIGELRRQYELLAAEEENAAAALKSMAAYHEKAATALGQPSPARSVTRANPSDSAFRR